MPVSVKSFRVNVPQKDSSPSQQAIYTSLGIGPALSGLYHLVQRGQIPAIQIGGRFCAVALLGPTFNAWRQSTAERAKTNQAISQPLAPTPTPGPTVSMRQQSRPAPRAVLVKLPPPRAQLVRLPEWKLGEERQLIMP